MDHCRRIVTGIGALKHWLFDDTPAQIAFVIAKPHSFVDGLRDIAANEVQILTNVAVNDHGAGILTHGLMFLARQLGIGEDLIEAVNAEWRFFLSASLLQRLLHILWQIGVHLHRPGADGLGNFFHV